MVIRSEARPPILWRRHILPGIVCIVLRGFFDPSSLLLRHRAFHLGRRTEDEALGRNNHTLSDQRSGSHNAVFPDHGAVHHNRAHADQDAILDCASVQDHMVADGDVVSNDERMGVVGDVQEAKVLNVGTVADTDVVHVAPHDGMKPDAGLVSENHITYDHSRFLDERRLGDCWGGSLKGANHSGILR